MVSWALVPFVLSALLTALCAAFVLRRRAQPGATAFAWLLVAETLWSVGYTFELASPGLSEKIFWDDAQWVATVAIIPCMSCFAWAYRERFPRRLKLTLALMMVVPLATVAWVFTDPLHGLARKSAHLEPSPPFDVLLYDFSAIEWLVILQSYATLAYVIALLVRATRRQHRTHRLQIIVIIFGLVLPTVVSTAGIAGYVRVLGQRDMSPACFGVSALAITWALFQRRFFDLAPVARHVVFEQLPDPLLVIDGAGRIIDLNPYAHTLFGTRAHNVGQPLVALVGDQKTAEQLLELTQAGQGAVVELSLGRSTFEARCEALCARGGELRGHVVLLRDVSARKAAELALQRAHDSLEQRVRERTRELHEANATMAQEIAERRRAEDEARDSERRFRALFDGAVHLIGTLAPDGRVLAANRTALDYGGVAAKDVVGTLFWEGPWWRHSPELRAQLRQAVARAADGELVTMEVTHPDRNGVVRDFDFSLKPLMPDAHDGLTLIAEGRDITDLRRAERERAHLREELHHAQKLDSIGRLAGGIAHDFNNLLTVILGQIELALSAAQRGQAVSACLEPAMQAGFSAADLTRQLLAFARKQPNAPRVLSLNEVVAQIHRMLMRLIGEDIELSLELSDDVARVRIDQGHLEQIILNLTVNARDAMTGGGRLRIATENVAVEPSLLRARGLPEAPNDYACMRVMDSGSGISPEVLARMFEPFFTTKSQGKGTGIGLSTVYGLVTQAGGFIDVQTEQGVGTTFAIFLPATHADRQQSLRPPSPEIPWGTEHIALVEDQAPLRELVSQQLGRLGYQVIAFDRAERALTALSSRTQRVDLLVSDVVLGGMSGPELVQQLRGERPSLKVLYISGYTDGEVSERGLDEAREQLLHKPFTLRDLAQAVRGVLDGKAS